ncbi:hypothetical protein RhiJN_24445 [Ceratobasidium sp. AG-Ba]|nr:hypothetical protein RhiJN_24445 [Ceratobasidium sp. AG-Ba]
MSWNMRQWKSWDWHNYLFQLLSFTFRFATNQVAPTESVAIVEMPASRRSYLWHRGALIIIVATMKREVLQSSDERLRRIALRAPNRERCSDEYESFATMN